MILNQKKLINGLLVLLCILFVLVLGPRLLMAANNMSLIASPTSVTADGFTPSLITATVDNSGTPELGVGLTYTTSLGRFSSGGTSIDTFSDGTGKSVVALTSLNVGIATVTCTTTTGPVIVRTVYVNFSAIPQPTPTPAPPYFQSFVLSADPPAVPAYDPSVSVADFKFSTISAQLYDQYGAPLALPGVSVIFTTTPAGLAHFSNKLTTITVSTDGSGKATALLYSPVVGTAAVNAKIGVLTTNPVFVNFIGPGPTAFIVITANPMSDNPADNVSFSTITATLYDIYGRAVNSGIKVIFKTTLGKFSNNDISIDAYTDSKGIATAYVSSGSIGTAQISASSNGVTSYVNVSFIGVGPPAFISLNAAPNWIPADGYSYTAITAVILDSTAQPVAPGTLVTFSTTLGVFINGKSTYQTVTPDDKGTVTAYLRSSSTISSGTAVISCTAGSVTQTLTVGIVRLEYETEPNNDMAHADAICFDNVFLSQLFNPYEEDWYTFTILQPTRISINFITTAIPAIAGDCATSTTVGTYRVDIRDKDNNVLMSYQNVDCSLDNGIWETGVVPAGTYYVVVFCPRLPDNSHYLSSPYYIAVFDNFYLPCNQLVNSASLSLEASAYCLTVPVIDTTPYLSADFQYDPIRGMFWLANYKELANSNDYRFCNLSTLSLIDGNYVLRIPSVIFDGRSYRVELTYMPTVDGTIWFMLSGAWLN
jgi:hypothetical protein